MAWVEVHGGQRSLAFELSFRAQRSLAFKLTTVPHNHRTVTTRLVFVFVHLANEVRCNYALSLV